ncbi:MAG: hypothetical protein HQ593_07585 [Candidatus Omnitrophica bacterium]|nr:hypothetical protein [Candidatus Omnitrophota bacterium]
MLSKNDYQGYLNQIVGLERKMSLVYKDCAKNTEDERIKKTCGGLSIAEERHAVMVQELAGLLTF